MSRERFQDPFKEERKPDYKYKAPEKRTVKKLGARMNIHKTPDVFGEVAVNLPAGSIVEVVSSDKEWTKIKQGYVMSVFLDDI